MEGARTAVIVDDDADVRLILRIALGASSFTVHEAGTGLDGVELARREGPDLITLDLNLPGIDGVETCRRIRDFTDAYIIMITSSLDEADRLVSLAIGADDYITKPFSPREVQARVEAMFRRPRPGVQPMRTPARGIPQVRSAERADTAVGSGSPAATVPQPRSDPDLSAPSVPSAPSAPSELHHNGLVVDAEGRAAWLAGVELPLTRTEFDLLLTLIGNPRKVWRRDALLDTIWGGRWSEHHVVEVHMGNLRRKLDSAQDGGAALIKTVRGVGYRMTPPSGSAPPEPERSSESTERAR
jgi:two-component system OmpR family response regulator